MDIRDNIISPDFKITDDIDGDIYVRDEKLSSAVKWQLVKYAIRKCIYWLEYALLAILIVWATPELPVEIFAIFAIALALLAVLPTCIRTYYVIRHSYILRDRIYLRNVERECVGKRNSFFVESCYCRAKFNKILPDGTVSEHEVKASKEVYEKKECTEAARLTVFVYKHRPYYMVDDSLK